MDINLNFVVRLLCFIGITMSMKSDLTNISMTYIKNNSEAIVNLEWSNGEKRTETLKRVGRFCNYQGSFQEESDSQILVGGCQDELLQVQIQSSKFGDTLGKTLTNNGNVDIVEGPGVIDNVKGVDSDFEEAFLNNLNTTTSTTETVDVDEITDNITEVNTTIPIGK